VAPIPDHQLPHLARLLITVLGEHVAAAVAGKCNVSYGSHPLDAETRRLARALIDALGRKRYRQLDVF
jgi:hypothetical protein